MWINSQIYILEVVSASRCPRIYRSPNIWEDLKNFTPKSVGSSVGHIINLSWSEENKDWMVAQWSQSSNQMKTKFAFHLEITLTEPGGRVERHRILKSSVSCNSCWCWSTEFLSGSKSSYEMFSMRSLSSCCSFMCWFHLPARLGPCSTRSTKTSPWCHHELNPIEMASKPRFPDAIIHKKGAPTKY